MSYKPLERLKISKTKLKESRFVSSDALKGIAEKFRNVIIEFYTEGVFSEFFRQLALSEIPLSDKKSLYVTINDSAKTDFMLAFQGNRVTLSFNYNKIKPELLRELVSIFSRGSEELSSRVIKLIFSEGMTLNALKCLKDLNPEKLPVQILLTTDNILNFCQIVSEFNERLDWVTLITSDKEFITYRNESIKTLEVFSKNVKEALSLISVWKNATYMYLEISQEALEVARRLGEMINENVKMQIYEIDKNSLSIRLEADSKAVEVKFDKSLDTDVIAKIVQRLVKKKIFGTVIIGKENVKLILNAGKPVIKSFNEFLKQVEI